MGQGYFTKELRDIFKNKRRTGYTTNMAKMCVENDFPLIVPNTDHISRITEQFPSLRCISLSRFQDPGPAYPLYMDNAAIHYLLSEFDDLEHKHDLLLAEHSDLTTKNDELFDNFISLREQIIKEIDKNFRLAKQLEVLVKLEKRSLLKKIIDLIKKRRLWFV